MKWAGNMRIRIHRIERLGEGTLKIHYYGGPTYVEDCKYLAGLLDGEVTREPEPPEIKETWFYFKPTNSNLTRDEVIRTFNADSEVNVDNLLP